jgi:hypothetical protein
MYMTLLADVVTVSSDLAATNSLDVADWAITVQPGGHTG